VRRCSDHVDTVSYPELFGVADNNPFGLKVYAFRKLCGEDRAAINGFIANIFFYEIETPSEEYGRRSW
jgi:hypothetical protein